MVDRALYRELAKGAIQRSWESRRQSWPNARSRCGSGGAIAFWSVSRPRTPDSSPSTREAMGHIDRRGGRFVTVLPRTRKEDARLREWLTGTAPEWTEAHRRPGKRKDDADEVWSVTPAPFPTSEGHRITWVHSTAWQRPRRDRALGADRTGPALRELSERLADLRARITTSAVEEAAASILAGLGAERYLHLTVTETVKSTTAKRSADAQARTPATASSPRPASSSTSRSTPTPFATTPPPTAASLSPPSTASLSGAEILTAYRYQPKLE